MNNMNRRTFFGFFILPILGFPFIKRLLSKTHNWEGPFYGVDFGSPEKDITIVEFSVNGEMRYLSDQYSIGQRHLSKIESLWMNGSKYTYYPGLLIELKRDLNNPLRAEMKWREI